MKVQRWQDWVNLILGAWLFVSPWAMRYAGDLSNAAWNAWLLGAAVVLFAAVAVYMPRAWEEAINIVLGIWTAISPWVLGFASNREVMLNTAIIGVVVTLLAIWAMAQDRDVLHRHADTHSTTA